MNTGYNTDVEFEGRVYHVQTEDKGQANPLIESLVYTGGEILTSRRSSYRDLLESAEFSEAALQKRMEAQHQLLIRDIRNGKFDPEGPKPFGYNLISNRSLDEVVLEYLHHDLPVEPIRLETVGHRPLVAGQAARLALRVLSEESERPVAGAEIRVKLLSSNGRPHVVFAGRTGEDGLLEAALDIPILPDGEAAVLIQADAAGRNAELKQWVRKAPAKPENEPA